MPSITPLYVWIAAADSRALHGDRDLGQLVRHRRVGFCHPDADIRDGMTAGQVVGETMSGARQRRLVEEFLATAAPGESSN